MYSILKHLTRKGLLKILAEGWPPQEFDYFSSSSAPLPPLSEPESLLSLSLPLSSSPLLSFWLLSSWPLLSLLLLPPLLSSLPLPSLLFSSVPELSLSLLFESEPLPLFDPLFSLLSEVSVSSTCGDSLPDPGPELFS